MHIQNPSDRDICYMHLNSKSVRALNVQHRHHMRSQETILLQKFTLYIDIFTYYCVIFFIYLS